MLAGLHLAWLREEQLPRGYAWLSPRERAVLAGLRVPKRRLDWLLGRCAAKRAVCALLGSAMDGGRTADIEVLASESGRPQVHIGPCETQAAGSGRGAPDDTRSAHAPVQLSISHVAGVGFAAATSAGCTVGCDVEAVEPRSEAFVADYLTVRERVRLEAAAERLRPLLVNLIWSGKESALKALGEGLRMDTRSVEVDVPPSALAQGVRGDVGWHPLEVAGPAGRRHRGWWRTRDDLVWTVVTSD